MLGKSSSFPHLFILPSPSSFPLHFFCAFICFSSPDHSSNWRLWQSNHFNRGPQRQGIQLYGLQNQSWNFLEPRAFHTWVNSPGNQILTCVPRAYRRTCTWPKVTIHVVEVSSTPGWRRIMKSWLYNFAHLEALERTQNLESSIFCS